MVLFSDYDNLRGRDTASTRGTGTGGLFNGGAVEVQGPELVLARLLVDRGTFRVPLRLRYTYTQAEFWSSLVTGFADWQPEVLAGDELPGFGATALRSCPKTLLGPRRRAWIVEPRPGG